MRKEETCEKEKQKKIAANYSSGIDYQYAGYCNATNDFVGQRSSCCKRGST